MTDDLHYRSIFLLDVMEKYAEGDDSILEIGSGDSRNIFILKEAGYTNVTGIDKLHNTAIEDIEPTPYDIIFTMSTLFLIKDESVFKKIVDMAQKYIITIEGETTKGNGVIGRDYSKVFEPLGFRQVEHQENVFNVFGHLRVFQKL